MPGRPEVRKEDHDGPNAIYVQGRGDDRKQKKRSNGKRWTKGGSTGTPVRGGVPRIRVDSQEIRIFDIPGAYRSKKMLLLRPRNLQRLTSKPKGVWIPGGGGSSFGLVRRY